MRKAAKQIGLGAAALVLLCAVVRFIFFNSFSLYIPAAYNTDESPDQWAARISIDHPEVLGTGTAVIRNGFVQIPVYALTPGEAAVTVSTDDETVSIYNVLKVDRFRSVYDFGTGNFTGDTAVVISITLFWLLISAIMLWHFFQAKGAAFYDYSTIYYAGFSLFALATGLVMLSVTVSRLAHPESYSMYSAYAAVSGASVRYMMLTTPVILFFAAAVAVSNIALLRHERPRPQNILGLLLSILLLIGEGTGWYLFTLNIMGSDWQGRLSNALQNTYATLFIYCQCMLTGAVICGIKAARHIPAADKDFIIILGCWFRPDGTLPPLLRGRADQALSFWRSQREKTGKEARFVPSGGQGRNEPMPEANAIRNYLLSRDVEDRLILPETGSVNTLQNMEFSREIIQNTDPKGKIIFSTSSYHVFRSGLLAKEAGLSAEGIGCRTKWWFWPNAFVRETAGLLQKRWKQEVLFLIVLVVFFDMLSLVLG